RLVTLKNIDEKATLVEAVEQDSAGGAQFAGLRRPSIGIALNDTKLHAIAERKVVHRQPVAVADFHDDSEERVAIAREMNRPGKGGAKVVAVLCLQAYAAIMDAADRFALAVAQSLGERCERRRRRKDDTDFFAVQDVERLGDDVIQIALA